MCVLEHMVHKGSVGHGSVGYRWIGPYRLSSLPMSIVGRPRAEHCRCRRSIVFAMVLGGLVL